MTVKREPTAEEWACSRAIREELRELNKAPTPAPLGLTDLQIHIAVNVALACMMAMHDTAEHRE
jgi:hypothetical protein